MTGYLKPAADEIDGMMTRRILMILTELPRQFRWSYVPPLMVYLAAGISGLTAIVGTFFVKDYLNLSAGFLASLGFLGRFTMGVENAAWPSC